MRHSLCAPEKKMDDVGGDCRRKKLLIGSFFQSRPRAKKRRHYLLHTDFFCGFKTQISTEFNRLLWGNRTVNYCSIDCNILFPFHSAPNLLQYLIFINHALCKVHIFCEGHAKSKCEGNCGLWVLNEIIKKIYTESLKKIVGAVWELPAK